MNKQEKRLLEDVQKACLWLYSNAPSAYENSGIEPAIRALSAVAAAMPEQSSHRERLVEAIAPKAFNHVQEMMLRVDPSLERQQAAPKIIGMLVKESVDAILEAENATNP